MLRPLYVTALTDQQHPVHIDAASSHTSATVMLLLCDILLQGTLSSTHAHHVQGRTPLP
jgi:hypothetical protein